MFLRFLRGEKIKCRHSIDHLRFPTCELPARAGKLAMLTCYDYTTARLMQRAGVPMLLVGDSAANVILGHVSTLPIRLSFMIELTAAVRWAAGDGDRGYAVWVVPRPRRPRA